MKKKRKYTKRSGWWKSEAGVQKRIAKVKKILTPCVLPDPSSPPDKDVAEIIVKHYGQLKADAPGLARPPVRQTLSLELLVSLSGVLNPKIPARIAVKELCTLLGMD